MPSLTFWFEFASTYSYPAAERIERLASVAGLKVEWRPFLLGPIFQSQGMNDSPFNLFPVKGRYMWRDLERICERDGIPFRRPSTFPRNGLLAARVATAGDGEIWLPDFVRRVYRANFVDDLEISDSSVLAEILDSLGAPASDFLERAQSAETKLRLRTETEAAERLGVFGAPTLMVGGELFWGNDRLEQAVEWARSRA